MEYRREITIRFYKCDRIGPYDSAQKRIRFWKIDSIAGLIYIIQLYNYSNIII